MKLTKDQLIEEIANWNVTHLDIDMLQFIAKSVEKEELKNLSINMLEALHARKIGSK